MKRAPLAALLLVAVVLAGCAGNGDGADSDDDGISDADERRGFGIVVDLVGRRVSYTAQPDPSLEDTDGDGLGDGFEVQLLPPLDPTRADTDGDGLTDCQEALHSVREECESPTWTGQTDGGTGTDPANADSDVGYSRYVTHTLEFRDETGTVPTPVPWGDGIPDGEELAGYNVTLGDGRVRLVQTGPRSGDSDGDGLEDGEERFLYGSDPTVFDTDGDGCKDGLDPFPAHTERYGLGLDSLRLHAADRVELVLQVNIAEHTFLHPDDPRTLHGSGPHDLDDAGPAPLAWRSCRASPVDPWMRVQLQTYHENEDGLQTLDITSGNVPTDDGGITPFVWWNLHTGRFSWEHEGEEFDAPLVWAGADATLTWHPWVDLGTGPGDAGAWTGPGSARTWYPWAE